jgi:O-antigen/teichoic acid export membrane protein
MTGGPVAVGWFSLAQQLAERIQLPVLALQETAFSRMSAATAADASVATQRYTRITAIAGVAGAILAVLAAPVVLPALFGVPFSAAVEPFQILMAAMPLAGVGFLLTPYVIAHARRPGLLSVVTWGQVLVLIAIAAVIGSQLDATRIAVASAIAQSLSFVAMIFLFGQLSGRSPLDLLRFGASDLRLARDVLRSAMRR